VTKTTGFYPRLTVDTTASGAVGQAGGVQLTETITATGLGGELSAALSRWTPSIGVASRTIRTLQASTGSMATGRMRRPSHT
jgi:hypothetical protein